MTITKSEAVQKFVADELSSIPQDWVKIVAEEKGEEIYAWPMWGTMWLCEFPGAQELYDNARRMAYAPEDIDLDRMGEVERARVQKAINEEDWTVLEEYVSHEMSDARCVLDKEGKTTPIFIYEIDGQIVIGVNGAGWNFFDGAWDKLYDILGLQWHSNV